MNALNNLRSRVKAPARFEMTLLSGEKADEGGEAPSQVQVEPKTYFANERTFIQWISAALLLLTVSSIMMGSGEYNGTSSVIAFSALILVFYASFIYFRRVQLLQSGNAYGYLDFFGPSILAVGVGLGVTIVFADAVKGSEFLPWGKPSKKDRRFLMSGPPAFPFEASEMIRPVDYVKRLQEVDGKCSRHSIHGINLLEYQPRDVILKSGELIFATPQALVSHPLIDKAAIAIVSEIPDMEITSLSMVGDRLYALSIGPSITELIEFDESAEIASTLTVQDDSTSTTGSIVFVPGEHQGRHYIYLDGMMHTYHLISNKINEAPVALSRTGSINMRVLNNGGPLDDPIKAMVHFEGLTYILREKRNVIEAWDLNIATLVAEMSLPAVSKDDQWVGMAFERRDDERQEKTAFHPLRKSKVVKTSTEVYLHMPLDTFPPQLWSFRLDELDTEKENYRSIFSFPECVGEAIN